MPLRTPRLRCPSPVAWALRSFVALVLACAASAQALDLNAANRAQLESAPGIGTVKAEAILSERERNGPFRSWADLVRRVRGIGAHTAERIRAGGLELPDPPDPQDLQHPPAPALPPSR